MSTTIYKRNVSETNWYKVSVPRETLDHVTNSTYNNIKMASCIYIFWIFGLWGIMGFKLPSLVWRCGHLSNWSTLYTCIINCTKAYKKNNIIFHKIINNNIKSYFTTINISVFINFDIIFFLKTKMLVRWHIVHHIVASTICYGLNEEKASIYTRNTNWFAIVRGSLIDKLKDCNFGVTKMLDIIIYLIQFLIFGLTFLHI